MRSIKKILFGILFLLIGTAGAFAEIQNAGTWILFRNYYNAGGGGAAVVDGSTINVTANFINNLAANLGAPTNNNLTIKSDNATVRILDGTQRIGFILLNKQMWFSNLTLTNFLGGAMSATGSSTMTFSGTMNFVTNTKYTTLRYMTMQGAGLFIGASVSTASAKTVGGAITAVNFNFAQVNISSNVICQAYGDTIYGSALQGGGLFVGGAIAMFTNGAANTSSNGNVKLNFNTSNINISSNTIMTTNNDTRNRYSEGDAYQGIGIFAGGAISGGVNGDNGLNTANSGVVKIYFSSSNVNITSNGFSNSFNQQNQGQTNGILVQGIGLFAGGALSVAHKDGSIVSSAVDGIVVIDFSSANVKILYNRATIGSDGGTRSVLQGAGLFAAGVITGGDKGTVTNISASSATVTVNFTSSIVNISSNIINPPTFMSAQGGGLFIGGAIIAAIHNGVGTHISSGGTVNVNVINSSFTVGYNLAFQGGGMFIVGAGVTRVSGGTIGAQYGTANVLFQNSTATFIGNIARDNGGAIYIAANDLVDASGATATNGKAVLSFVNSSVSFTSNTASGSGGAIYATGGSTITFSNSTASFISNRAASGGAIYVTDPSLVAFENSRASFTSNTATNGGAIYLNAKGAVTFNNSTVSFTSNSATTNGGAIFISGSSMTFNAINNNISFVNNKAAGKPNDIYMAASRLNLNANSKQIRFEGGIVATNKSTITFSNTAGGSLYLSGINDFDNMGLFSLTNNSSVTVINSTFTYRNNGKSGTIQFSGSIIDFNNSSVTFRNNSGSLGGVVTVEGNSTISFTNSKVSFMSNSSDYSGGVFSTRFSMESRIIFSNSVAVFSGNFVNATIGGGVIDFVLGQLSVKDSTINFVNNWVTGGVGGGVINVESSAIIDFSDSLINFTKNSATNIGGVITASNSGVTYISFIGSTVSFISNSANSGGAFYLGNNKFVTFIGSSISFMGNEARTARGGAIYLQGSSSITFSDTKVSFIDNRGGEAGAIYNGSGFIDFNNSTVTFIRNFSQMGAVVEMEGVSTLSFTKSQADFIGNYATYAGGVFAFRYSMESLVLLTSSVVSFSGNYATGGVGGGVAYIGIGQIGVTNSTVNFTNNWATGGTSGGGVIIVEDSAIIDFTNSLVNFTSNSAINNRGGVISAVANATYISFTGSTVSFTSNSANNGGVFYLENNDKFLTFAGSSISFMGNKAVNGSGGVIYLQGKSSITFSDTKVSFTSNTAATKGGAIFIGGGSTIAFVNSTVSFTGNSGNQGGAMYIDNAIVNFGVGSKIKFLDNTAQYGGAIYIANKSIVTIAINLEFSGNTATSNGGAIYNDASLIFDSSYENLLIQAGADIYNTRIATITIRGNNGVTIDGGIRGFGTINKEEGGALYLHGNDNKFSGIFNQNAGQTIVSTNYFSGVTNINGGDVVFGNGTVLSAGTMINIGEQGRLLLSVNQDYELNFVGGVTITSVTELGWASPGYGIIKKDGAGQLNIRADYSNSRVGFEQYAGTTTVMNINDNRGKLFGGQNYIQTSLLQVSGNSIYYKLNIGNNGRLENTLDSASIGDGRITADKINFVGANSTATFTSVGSVGYALESIGNSNNGSDNRVIFSNVNVTLINPGSFKSQNIRYIFDHSNLDLTELTTIKSTKTVRFDYLESQGATLGFGFNMISKVPFSEGHPVSNIEDIIIGADKLIVSDGVGSFIDMNGVRSYNVANMEVINLDPEVTWFWSYIPVLEGIQFESDASATIAGMLYRYVINAAQNGFGVYNGIMLTITPPPDNRLFNISNEIGGFGRVFNQYPTGSKLVNGSIVQDYHISKDFNSSDMDSKTRGGSLEILGERGEAKDIIISGILKGQSTIKGSFFTFDGDTYGNSAITIKNITIRDAYKTGDGSVLSMPKPTDAVLAATFKDAIIRNNEASGKGGAVSAESGRIDISGTQFLSNRSHEDGGALYASNIAIGYADTTVFSGNRAYNNGGAVYMVGSTMTNNGGEINFLGNRSESGGSGGAIYASGGSLSGFSGGKVNFIGNRATQGGAVYVEDSVIAFGSPVFKDNTAGIGGAIYIKGSASDNGIYKSTVTIVAATQNVLFSNNTDSYGKNDIRIDETNGNVLLRLETRSADMRMEGGVWGGTSNSKIIKFGSGELNFGGWIDFAGTIEVQEGTFRLGQMKPKEHPYNPSIPTDEMYIRGDLIINEGATWSSLNGMKDYVRITGNMILNGILRFYVDYDLDTTDEIYANQIIIDGDTAIFDIGMLGHNNVVAGSSVPIMLATNGIFGINDGEIDGRLGRVEYVIDLQQNASYGGNPYATIAWVRVTNKLNLGDVSDLTPNQDVVKDLFEKMGDGTLDDLQKPFLDALENGQNSRLKEMFDKVGGSFLANTIHLAARNNNSQIVMERMTKALPSYITYFTNKESFFDKFKKKDAKDSALERQWRWGDRDKYIPVWVEADINGLNVNGKNTTLGDFKSTGFGVQAGADLWFGDSSVRGVYGAVNKKDIKQGTDKADVSDIELGVYGAYMFNKVGVRGVFGLGIQNFQTTRYLDFYQGGVSPQADFYVFNTRFSAEAEYTIRREKFDFKPFIGVQGGFIVNGTIEESGGGQANLVVDSDSHLRLAGLTGLKIENKESMINWYAKAFVGYIFTGNESEYNIRFAQAQDFGAMKIKTLDEGDIFGGLGAGAEYDITKRITAYTDGQLLASADLTEYSLGAGMKYQFDQKKINDQIAKIEEKNEKEKEKIENEILGLTESKAAQKARLKAEKDAKKQAEKEAKELAKKQTQGQTQGQAQEQAQAQAQAQKDGLQVQETIASFAVTAAQFESDSFTLKAKGRELLTELALKIKGMRFNSITIKGHTDSTGSKEYNQQLSIKRAKSVYDALVSELPQDKLKYEGYGQDFPKATNATKEGRAENRRVDVEVE